MKNIDIIKDLYQKMADKDHDGIREILDPHVEWSLMPGLPGGGNLLGIDSFFESVLQPATENWTGWKEVPGTFIANGSRVVVTGHYEGVFKKTRRLLKASFSHHFTLKSGKVVRVEQFTDTFLFAKAMGLC